MQIVYRLDDDRIENVAPVYCGQSTLWHFLNSAKVGQSLAQTPLGFTIILLTLLRNLSPQVALHFDHIDHGVTSQSTETL
jgi:hypothetical protein